MFVTGGGETTVQAKHSMTWTQIYPVISSKGMCPT